MQTWLQYTLAIGLLVVVMPLVAWTAKRYGRGFRGNLALGAILLGFGEVVDPPSKHMIEATTKEKESPTPGDPPAVD